MCLRRPGRARSRVCPARLMAKELTKMVQVIFLPNDCRNGKKCDLSKSIKLGSKGCFGPLQYRTVCQGFGLGPARV